MVLLGLLRMALAYTARDLDYIVETSDKDENEEIIFSLPLDQGWRLFRQFPPLRFFATFLNCKKTTLCMKYPIHI